MQTVNTNSSNIGGGGGQNGLEYASLVSNWEMPNQLAPRPSIFDILAQESMHGLFKSAFDHLIRHLVTTRPRGAQHTRPFAVLQLMGRYADECYLLAHSLIEWMYLKAFDALFSEHFYNLKRVSSTAFKSNKKMRTVMTALVSILVPYVKSKLDSLYEELDKSTTDTPTDSRIVKVILKYYPYFHLFWSLVFWYYRIAFMCKTSDYHSPVMAALGQRLVYNTAAFDSVSSLSLKTNFLKTVLYWSSSAFTTGMYLLQFIKWYQENDDDNDNNNTEESLDSISSDQVGRTICNIVRPNNDDQIDDVDDDIMPAPSLPDKLVKSKPYRMLVEKSNTCPLCNRTRSSNQCVLAVSGFCFCYPCIFKFVKEHKRCPVTSFPCSTKSIIRLYVTSSTD